jgi:membrane-bound lytic murein transglycosylase F
MSSELSVPKRLAWRRWVVLLIAPIMATCGNDRFEKQPGELLVGVLDDPVFYQRAVEGSDQGGFEFDLIEDFAASLNKKIRVVVARNPGELREFLDHDTVDFVAGMPRQDDPQLRYTTPLREAKPLLVQHADAVPIPDLASLAGRVVGVLPGTIQETILRDLPVAQPVDIQNPSVSNGIDLLQGLAERRSELVATDSIHLDSAINFYPDLVVALELPGTVAFTWAFRSTDESLYAQAEAFTLKARQDGTVARTRDRYFGHYKRINPTGATQFIDDIHTLLPRYRRAFQDAQALTGLDWRLLAALSYQESKWDPMATSYTGVRGIMMLTEETADRLGVENRLDPGQSILAGARYLAELKSRLPDTATDPDRQWLAVAAYNLGMGHLRGARQFAVGMKRDPNSWYDMKKVLPLMSQPEYYERLKSGRARGGEAVILVENVRIFYDILARLESPHSPIQTDLTMQ